MKSQLQYLKQNYASLKSINNLNYPMLSSSEVITCDNSNIDPKNIIDENRKDFVFSVPYYDNSGQLAGIISGIILKSVLNGFLTVTTDQEDKYSLSQTANNIQQRINQFVLNSRENLDSHDIPSTNLTKIKEASDKIIQMTLMISIHVTGCGPGIPQELQEKIMNPFFTTKKQGKGTGLGLSISMGIIKDHAGELTYNPQSKNTSGSNF